MTSSRVHRKFRNHWINLCFIMQKLNGNRSITQRRFRILLLVFVVFVVCAFMWLFARYHFSPEFVTTDQLYLCIRDRIKPFLSKIEHLDALLHSNNDPVSNFISFVGNGRFGCSFQHDTLLIRVDNLFFMPTEIPVLVNLDVHGYLSEVSYVLDILDGMMHRVQCFKHEKELCVSSGTSVYAHRLYTSLLVQNFLFYNPLPSNVAVKLQKPELTTMKSPMALRTIRLKQKRTQAKNRQHAIVYQVLSTVVNQTFSNPPAPGGVIAEVIVVTVFEPVIPESLTVMSGRSETHTFITGVRSSSRAIPVTPSDLAQFTSDDSILGRERKALEQAILSELTIALQLEEDVLRQLHVAAWNMLWLSGLTLSYSHAPKALNGDRINVTMYYLATASVDHNAIELYSGNKSSSLLPVIFMEQPRPRTACSPNVSLSSTDEHWRTVGSIDQLNVLLDRWMQTFYTKHCGAFLEAGAQGAIQAVLTAVGSIRRYEHLATIGLHPHTLNRDLQLRRISLNNPGVFVNFEIRVVPGEVSLSSPHLMIFNLNVWRARPPQSLALLAKAKTRQMRPVLSQSLDSQLILPIKPFELNDDRYEDISTWLEKQTESLAVFVCPAACEHDPLEIKYSKTNVPFLLTKPPSELLYIGTNEQAIIKQARANNYEEVKPGPNADHDIITLHRHGHAFGGLPWLFWICLGLLITLFHLFFCKVIYNELLRDKSDIDAENAWSLQKTYADLGFPGAAAAHCTKADLASRRRHHRQSDRVP